MLHRPYIRSEVRAEVEARAARNEKGQFLDANTGKVIEGQYDLGHKAGHEFRTEQAKAEKEGLTQEEFNERMNNPDLYQIEDPSSNRSHQFEAGKDISETNTNGKSADGEDNTSGNGAKGETGTAEDGSKGESDTTGNGAKGETGTAEDGSKGESDTTGNGAKGETGTAEDGSKGESDTAEDGAKGETEAQGNADDGNTDDGNSDDDGDSGDDGNSGGSDGDDDGDSM